LRAWRCPWGMKGENKEGGGRGGGKGGVEGVFAVYLNKFAHGGGCKGTYRWKTGARYLGQLP
jgi:hypothetical protein